MKKIAKPRKRKRPARGAAAGPSAPSARVPLPAKSEKRHGDATKYSRPREKRRWREETKGAP